VKKKGEGKKKEKGARRSRDCGNERRAGAAAEAARVDPRNDGSVLNPRGVRGRTI